jgi:hypothetical protein
MIYIENIRQQLVNMFWNNAQNYEGYKISDIPQLKQLHNDINKLDEIAKKCGYNYNIDKGCYVPIELINNS